MNLKGTKQCRTETAGFLEVGSLVVSNNDSETTEKKLAILEDGGRREEITLRSLAHA